MLAVGKIILLTLIAIYRAGGIDSDAYVDAPTLEACQQEGVELANEWRGHNPAVVAVLAHCEERDDPRIQLYEARPDLIPGPEPAPEDHPTPAPRVLGKDEASLHVEGHGG